MTAVTIRPCWSDRGHLTPLTQIETRSDGLLDAFIDPRGGRYEMTWDGLGRLLQNDDPAGGST